MGSGDVLAEVDGDALNELNNDAELHGEVALEACDWGITPLACGDRGKVP